MDTTLNDDWINDFDKTDKLYQDFYKDDLYYMNLKFIYINRNNEIEKIKEETFLMSSPNYISREEILKILKVTAFDSERRYSLLSILKYNFVLDTEDVKHFLISNQEIKYLTVVKNIDAIAFEKTISMFQDLNDLVFIFYEKSNELKKKDINNSTKKVYIETFSNNRKTIKKRYKD
jgi:hypothetical protein